MNHRPFHMLIRFSESPWPSLFDNTWDYGFLFSGSCLGPHFVVLASFDDISQTMAPFLTMQSFVESPGNQISDNTKVYGFLISGFCSGPHSVVIPPTITPSTRLSHGTKPLGGLSMDKKPSKITAEPSQPKKDPCPDKLLHKMATQLTLTSVQVTHSSSPPEIDRRPLKDAKPSTGLDFKSHPPPQSCEQPWHDKFCGSTAAQQLAISSTLDWVYYGSDSPEFDENYFYNSKPQVKVAAKLPQDCSATMCWTRGYYYIATCLFWSLYYWSTSPWFV